VKIAIVDDNGSTWKELDGGTPSGLAVVEYDLSADPKLADAAEARAKEKAAEKEKKADSGEKKPDADKKSEAADKKPAPPSGDEDEDDDAVDEKPAPPPAPPKKPLDPEVEKLLADPLRATRSRYLAPGKYSVEIRSGGETKKTPLVVKPEREDGGFFDATGDIE
jgi:hypothetical protein